MGSYLKLFSPVQVGAFHSPEVRDVKIRLVNFSNKLKRNEFFV